MINKIKKFRICLDENESVYIDNKEFLSVVDNITYTNDLYHGESYYTINLKNGKLIKLKQWDEDDWFITIGFDDYKELVKTYGKLNTSKLGRILYKDGKL